MTLLNIVQYTLTATIVLSAAETAMLGALIACEMLGIATAERLPAAFRWSRWGRSARLESAGFLLGQVFAVTATPYLVVMLVALRSAWVEQLMRPMLATSGTFAVLAMMLAFLAGLTACGPRVELPRSRPGFHRVTVSRGRTPEAA